MFGSSRRALLERAYPGIAFRPHTVGLLSRVMGSPAECVHLAADQSWMASLLPDTAYLKGKPRAQRMPPRPEATLCRECLPQALAPDLRGYAGRVLLFEPDPETVTQFFFVAREHFEEAYLQAEVARALAPRLEQAAGGACAREGCSRAATWLSFARREVASLDESALIAEAPGTALCAEHGAAQMLESLRAMPQVNIEYMNAPYGSAGAYLWF